MEKFEKNERVMLDAEYNNASTVIIKDITDRQLIARVASPDDLNNEWSVMVARLRKFENENQ